MVALFALLAAQIAQNPSPMVEHRRPHPRIAKSEPAGKREKLSLGTLFVPAGAKPDKLMVFFHGGEWLPEVAASRRKLAVIAIQIGAGSGVYVRAFEQADRFRNLLQEAEAKSGLRFRRVLLAGWSAGCGAIRTILRDAASYDRVDAALAIDGIHAGYEGGKPGPAESKLEAENLAMWLKLARDAVAGGKQLWITHSEIFPGTFASTTETADWLLQELRLTAASVSKKGPMGTQLLSEARAGRFRLQGYAGNTAPDHVDQLHSLPDYVRNMGW